MIYGHCHGHQLDQWYESGRWDDYVALLFAFKHALGHVKDGLNFLNAQKKKNYFQENLA